MSEMATLLGNVLALFGIALAVRILVRNRDRVAYASVLVAVGFLFSLWGRNLPFELESEIIILIFLPTIIFKGTVELDAAELWHDRRLIAVLTLVGLPLAVAILGGIGTVAFGFPLAIALLFAAIILPTDPAAVISMFQEFDVAERLAVTIEGESLLNDGVAIVIFSTLLATYTAAGESVTDLATPGGMVGFAGDIAVIGGGGLVLGIAIGAAAELVIRELYDEFTILLLTILVAYGGFLLAEHFLHLSGVLATVGAGLVIGSEEESLPRTAVGGFVQDVREGMGWLVTTVLYVLIGSAVEFHLFVEYADLVLVAAVLVVVVRALTIYPLVTLSNVTVGRPVPLRYQHIMVWGGLHTVVPVALVLSLPASFPAETRTVLETMVFGVAIISIIVQGLLMPLVLDVTGMAEDTSPAA